MDTCQLTELDLSQSGIDANTFGLLCRGILKRGGACTLEKLNLSENRIRGRMRGLRES